MLGPKIIDPSTLDVEINVNGTIKSPDEGFTGIRVHPNGRSTFTAIRNGRMVAQFTGVGAKAKAYKALNGTERR